jgi:hypothetical protein
VVTRINNRAQHSHPAQTMHTPVLLICFVCVAALALAVATGFTTLPGVGR